MGISSFDVLLIGRDDKTVHGIGENEASQLPICLSIYKRDLLEDMMKDRG